MESGNQDTEHMNHTTYQPTTPGIFTETASGYGTLTKTDHTPRHKTDLGTLTGGGQKCSRAELRIRNRKTPRKPSSAEKLKQNTYDSRFLFIRTYLYVVRVDRYGHVR